MSSQELLSAPLWTFARIEALCAGLASCIIEISIWHRLATRRRAMHYYHPIPIVAGLLLIAESAFPNVAWLSLAATAFACTTTLNVYNSYYVHIVALGTRWGYMPPKAIQRVDDAQTMIISYDDVFIPQHGQTFYPWGLAAQLAYTLTGVSHCLMRVYVTAHVLMM